MTLKQIEKTRTTIGELEELKNLPTPTAISRVDSSLENFFHELYKSPYLNISNHFAYGTELTNEEMIADIDDIISVLNGMLALDEKSSQILGILDLIDESKNLSDTFEDRQKFIAKVYYAYGDIIKFDKSIESVARTSIKNGVVLDMDWGIEENSIDDVVIMGIVQKLYLYAQELLQSKSAPKEKRSKPSIVINNNNSSNATATNNTSIDISVIFETARQNVSDEGLSDSQTQQLLEKINELEILSRSSESKGSKWMKIKETMKWLVEQGIAVAGILMPVITEVLK